MDDDGPIARLLHEDGPLAAADGEEPPRDADSNADPAPDDGSDGPESDPLEPESVSPEHAAFVLAGAALTLLVIVTAL